MVLRPWVWICCTIQCSLRTSSVFSRNQPLPEGVCPLIFLPRPLVFVSFRAFSALSDAVGPLSSLCQSGFPCANFYVPSNVQMPQNLRLSRKRLPAHFDGLRNDVGLGVFRFIFRKSMAKSMFFIQFSEYSLHELWNIVYLIYWFIAFRHG